MHARQQSRAVALELRAYYTIAELARAAGVTTFSLLRLLRRNEVVFLRTGRALFVPLSEIRTKIPPLWEGLLAKEELRAAGAQASRDAR